MLMILARALGRNQIQKVCRLVSYFLWHLTRQNELEVKWYKESKYIVPVLCIGKASLNVYHGNPWFGYNLHSQFSINKTMKKESEWTKTMTCLCGGFKMSHVMLRSWARHFTLRVPLSTHVHKCIPRNLMLGLCNGQASHPRRGRKILSCFMQRKMG